MDSRAASALPTIDHTLCQNTTQPQPPGDDTLLLSSLGVGTYLGAEDEAADEAQLCALLYSVMRGWNVIDTGARWGRAGCAVHS